jgi:hypothetical protein
VEAKAQEEAGARKEGEGGGEAGEKGSRQKSQGMVQYFIQQ